MEGIREKHNAKTSFKYMNTSENPADVIIRGISLEKFKAQFDFWVSGPSWLSGNQINWPASELNCLSADNRMVVLSNVIQCVESVNERDMFGLRRYASLAKLMRVVTHLLL